MATRYYMKALLAGTQVDWVVNDKPDSTGEFYPGGSAGLTNIVVNNVVDSKMPNRIKPLNSTDGYNFLLNSYDWLKSTRSGSDSDSATTAIPVPTNNVGLSIVRGTPDGSSPRSYASLYWNETQGTFISGYTDNHLSTLASTKPFITGHLNVVEGDEDGYLAITNNSKVPAVNGVIRVPNLEFFTSRDFTNTSDVTLLHADNEDRVVLGSGLDPIYIPLTLRVDGYITDGDPTLVATEGFVRSANASTILSVRNFAGSDNLTFLNSDTNDALLVGDSNNTDIIYNTGGEHEFFVNDVAVVRVDNITAGSAYISFDKDVFDPLVTQDDTTSGNGQNLTLKGQNTSGAFGGSVTLDAGSGATGDGYVDVRTAGAAKLRVFGSTVPGAMPDLPNNIGDSANSILLINNAVRFYDTITAPTIKQDPITSGVGEDLLILAQTTTDTVLGGDLFLSSGDSGTVGLEGAVELQTGTTVKLRVQPDGTTITYNSNFEFDGGLITPAIYQDYDATAVGENLSIVSQQGDTTGGKLILSSGIGGTNHGDVELSNGSVNSLVLSSDGYGTITSHLPTIIFESTAVESSNGTNKVIVTQEENSTTDITANEMQLSAQPASDGYGGKLVLSSGFGRSNIVDDGDVEMKLGLNLMASISSAADGYTTFDFFTDNVTISGDLTVDGTTTTINSTIVDIADRVIHVNHSAGANDPVPTNITGLSVHRGSVASVNRDHSAIVWAESDNLWKLALNTGGDDTTLGLTQGLLARSYLAQSTATIVTADIPTSGDFRSLNNTNVVVSRNNASTADLSLLGTSGSDQVLHGDANNAGHIFNAAAASTYDFNINSVLSVQLGDEFASFGVTPALTGVIRSAQSAGVAKSIIKSRNIADDNDLLVIGVDGFDGIVVGDIATAGVTLTSKGSNTIDSVVDGYTLLSSSSDKNVFTRGLRREVTIVTATHTVSDYENYLVINTTSGTFTVSLPPSPTEGDTYEVKDTGNALVNNFILNGNGNTIDGNATVTVSQNYISMIVTYVGGSVNEWLAS